MLQPQPPIRNLSLALLVFRVLRADDIDPILPPYALHSVSAVPRPPTFLYQPSMPHNFTPTPPRPGIQTYHAPITQLLYRTTHFHSALHLHTHSGRRGDGEARHNERLRQRHERACSGDDCGPEAEERGNGKHCGFVSTAAAVGWVLWVGREAVRFKATRGKQGWGGFSACGEGAWVVTRSMYIATPRGLYRAREVGSGSKYEMCSKAA